MRLARERCKLQALFYVLVAHMGGDATSENHSPVKKDVSVYIRHRVGVLSRVIVWSCVRLWRVHVFAFMVVLFAALFSYSWTLISTTF